ncbi:MAG: hypothetical protein GIW96_07525 [Candidatus Eremiobacteraeota bacterium]|nr:hypothetical protein [Candidatus Eremiobacteraeota bacterium]
MRPKRLELLSKQLAAAPRTLVVCYGKGDWPYFKQLFGAIDWAPKGHYETAQWRGSRVVLSHHFAGHDFNTDAQLAELSQVAFSP